LEVVNSKTFHPDEKHWNLQPPMTAGQFPKLAIPRLAPFTSLRSS
jgi:hypothetical protein